MDICSVEGCDEPTMARGMCSPHYGRQCRHGDPLAGGPPRIGLERFWTRVNKDGPLPACRPDLGPCWVWIGPLDRAGYGRQSGVLAYRYVWIRTHGPLPEGKPEHLEPVTHAENMARSVQSSASLTHCKRGHPFTDANTYRRPSGGRSCRQCTTEHQRLYKERLAAAS